jgi:hypothetical protein
VLVCHCFCWWLKGQTQRSHVTEGEGVKYVLFS